jgi:flagellin
MTSILTNTAAMSALSALTSTQSQLSKTQAQSSSGLAVANASDNEAYWSISKTMSAQIAGLSAAQQSLSLTKSIADVTTDALTQIISLSQSIQADVVTSQEAGVNLADIQQDIAGKQASIVSIVNSASFNGVNWLKSSGQYTVADTAYYDVHTGLTEDQGRGAAPLTNSYTETDEHYENVTITDPDMNTYTYKYDTNTSTYNYDVDSGGVQTLASAAIAQPTTTETETGVQDSVTSKVIASDSANGVVFAGINTASLSILSNVQATFSQGGELYFSDYSELPAFNTPTLTTLSTIGSHVSGVGVQDAMQTFLAQIVPQSPLTSILSINVSNGAMSSATQVQSLTDSVSELTSVADKVGAIETQISNMQSFNSSLSDALTSGIGSLVDADMNVASTRLQALQTQQQLGIQALSMANQNSLLILKLFQAA